MITAEELYYLTGVDLLEDNELMHYGVLGMKWGHRKGSYKQSNKKRKRISLFEGMRRARAYKKEYISELKQARNEGYYNLTDKKVSKVDPHGGPNGKQRYSYSGTKKYIIDWKDFHSKYAKDPRYRDPDAQQDLMDIELSKARRKEQSSWMTPAQFKKRTGVSLESELARDKLYEYDAIGVPITVRF